MPAAREDSNPLGVVYTPPEVAGPMARLALSPLVDGASSAEILALRLCDPAVGTGAFLVEVVTFLAHNLVDAWEREAATPTAAARPPSSLDASTWWIEAQTRVAQQCIIGVDIDAAALDVARRTLGIAPTNPNFRHGDALSFDWRAEFPDIFARGGFDAVVANPPYIRQERVPDKTFLVDYAVYDGVADLYVYFIELAHRLLRSGGRYAVIVPSKWMTADYGRALRFFLARAHSVDGVVDLSQHALFADADAFPCILWGTASSVADRERPLYAIRASATDSVEDVLLEGHLALALHGHKATLAARDLWGAGPWHIDTRPDRCLIERFERMYPSLGDVVGTRWSRGVVTGLNEAFVIDRVTRDALLAADAACAAWLRPFIKGRDVRRYHLGDSERWIVLVDRGTPFDDLPLPIRDHLAPFRRRLEPKPADHAGPEVWPGRKPGAYAWYELQDPVVPLAKSRAPRMFYQDIQTAPACSLDRAGDLVPDTTVWILPSSDLVLLALLNSQVYRWYAQRRFPPALNGAVRPKLAYMQRLPVPIVSPELRTQIEALVELRLAHPHESLATHTRDAHALEREIDALVATAYELTTAERALISS